ncbi:MAG: tRNA uridine-5-carboxymethylaminomethyl(34) synthesis GTPase MnmE, partial [Eubacterium sp.]|nr:tRNA uridine-5-carboxymethylaminomethyl(34) synthesis GTPase MnmE [Eubacterium sp.]
DKVEQIGVDKARTSISSADLVLLVLDGSDDITEDDKNLVKSIKDKKVIVLVNKSDKEESFNADRIRDLLAKEFKDELPAIIEFSAKTGGGKDLLKAKISELFYEGHLDYNSEVRITNVRHKGLVVDAEESLRKVLQSIEDGVGEDFYTIDLMAAYESLGTVIGESLEDDLADKIFKEFCMGK